MEDYKNKLGSLADKLKKDPPQTPIQQVNPVKSSVDVKEAEAQLNVWIPKKLLKTMKVYGLEHDLSLKDISIQALEIFLNKQSSASMDTKV